jgi:acyl carrier protein
MNIAERVQILIKDVLNADSISMDSCQDNIAEWDSMAYLTIVAALEKEFGVRIGPENINRFNSVKNIIKEVEKCL